jgi:hypothetical protein
MHQQLGSGPSYRTDFSNTVLTTDERQEILVSSIVAALAESYMSCTTVELYNAELQGKQR